MIWIIGEYAERIDNADELLESFLDGFHDENTQVCDILATELCAFCFSRIFCICKIAHLRVYGLQMYVYKIIFIIFHSKQNKICYILLT